MDEDDRPTRPLPVDPAAAGDEPVVAGHVPVADLPTAPLTPIGEGASVAGARSRWGRWAAIAAVVLGAAAIVLAALLIPWDETPLPAASPSMSPTPSVTPSVTPSDLGGPDETDAPAPPPAESPAPTAEPEPTPAPDPTGTPDPGVTPAG